MRWPLVIVPVSLSGVFVSVCVCGLRVGLLEEAALFSTSASPPSIRLNHHHRSMQEMYGCNVGSQVHRRADLHRDIDRSKIQTQGHPACTVLFRPMAPQANKRVAGIEEERGQYCCKVVPFVRTSMITEPRSLVVVVVVVGREGEDRAPAVCVRAQRLIARPSHPHAMCSQPYTTSGQPLEVAFAVGSDRLHSLLLLRVVVSVTQAVSTIQAAALLRTVRRIDDTHSSPGDWCI